MKKKTSIFSAAPGALVPLMILAEDQKSDLSHVATAHLIRLIIIITNFPFCKYLEINLHAFFNSLMFGSLFLLIGVGIHKIKISLFSNILEL